MVKVLLLIFFAGSLSIIGNSQGINFNNKLSKINPIDLNGFSIISRFSDCGEWGGHKEKFLIKAASKDSVFCIFKIYTVDCDTAMKEGFSISQKFLKDTMFILNEQMTGSFKNYFEKMLSSKLSHRI